MPSSFDAAIDGSVEQRRGDFPWILVDLRANMLFFEDWTEVEGTV